MSKKRIIIASGAVLCFAFIAFNVVMSISTGNAIAFDTVVRGAILSMRNDVLTPILIGITHLGDWEVLVLVCAVLLFFKKSRIAYGMPLAITITISAAIQSVIKGMIGRARPPVENFLIEQGGFSFPSGHSCTGLVFYGLLAYLLIHNNVDKNVHKFLATCSVVLFLLIGFSRVYVGVHYPTDILGGWSLGIAIVVISITLQDIIQKRDTLNMNK